jgi:hypothetical protein
VWASKEPKKLCFQHDHSPAAQPRKGAFEVKVGDTTIESLTVRGPPSLAFLFAVVLRRFCGALALLVVATELGSSVQQAAGTGHRRGRREGCEGSVSTLSLRAVRILLCSWMGVSMTLQRAKAA